MQEIILLKGLPASGKSTWAKDFVEHHVEYVRVNKDGLSFILENLKDIFNFFYSNRVESRKGLIEDKKIRR